MPPSRTLPVVAALLVLGLLAAAPARAEEVLILENGAVLRGDVVRETESALVVHLSDFSDGTRVTVDRHRIVRRFVSVEEVASGPARPATGGGLDWSVGAARAPPTEEIWAYGTEGRPTVPNEEPSVRAEGFFQRMARVTVLALPSAPLAQLVVALLLYVAILALVGMGMRLAEIDSMGLLRNGLTALVLASLLAADVYFHAQLLRADRAILVLPAEGVGWMLSASFLLRCGFARSVLLFAFVLFSLALVVFAAGAILVTF